MKPVSDNYPVDAVIAWVNGNDPHWQKEKAKYASNYQNPESTHPARFRDWDNLDLLVKGIQTNAPWIRHIFIVTNGQIPKWYDGNDPQIKLVFHKDFIPQKYLPTFNSHTIELNLHRITNLSEHFIYFNDDTFIINSMKKTDFFINGTPCDYGIMSIHCPKKSLMIYTICNNDTSIINEHFNLQQVINKNKAKWFNLKYGINFNLQNTILSRCPRFPGFKNFHLPQPFLKSTFKKVWQAEPTELEKTSSSKFREKDNVNQWLIKNWQICTGNFHPITVHDRGVLIDFEKNNQAQELKKCLRIIRGNKYKMICINDGDTISNYNHIKSQINAALKSKLLKGNVNET